MREIFSSRSDLMEEMAGLLKEIKRSGELVATEPLADPVQTKTVRRPTGRLWSPTGRRSTGCYQQAPSTDDTRTRFHPATRISSLEIASLPCAGSGTAKPGPRRLRCIGRRRRPTQRGLCLRVNTTTRSPRRFEHQRLLLLADGGGVAKSAGPSTMEKPARGVRGLPAQGATGAKKSSQRLLLLLTAPVDDVLGGVQPSEYQHRARSIHPMNLRKPRAALASPRGASAVSMWRSRKRASRSPVGFLFRAHASSRRAPGPPTLK
jgi:hypothetical protein